jgi:hypothetical protein
MLSDTTMPWPCVDFRPVGLRALELARLALHAQNWMRSRSELMLAYLYFRYIDASSMSPNQTPTPAHNIRRRPVPLQADRTTAWFIPMNKSKPLDAAMFYSGLATTLFCSLNDGYRAKPAGWTCPGTEATSIQDALAPLSGAQLPAELVLPPPGRLAPVPVHSFETLICAYAAMGMRPS